MDRRTFFKTAGGAGLGLHLPGAFSATARTRAPGDTVVVGVMGVNSRGHALAQAFAATEGAEVGFVCDVDERAVARCIETVGGLQAKKPRGVGDVRRLLEEPDLDALVIAAPDHWHAPAAILAMQAGKHVYLEKPGSQNAHEAGLVVRVQQQTDRLVQLGTQRRSAPRFIEAMAKVHDGLIGDAYYGKAWYANTRGSIGNGQPVDVPSWLDYELWQGPAPRRPYRDNLVHYNWHWFRHWGTGEACNNGTHHVDLCRWALGVDFPTRAVSSGGRFHFDDDWEFFDTQVMSFEFEGGKSITWEGRSCNGMPINGRGFGITIHGTGGSLVLDSQGYVFYDLDNRELERNMAGSGDDGLNPVGGGDMTDLHIANFCDAVREGTPLNQPIAEGYKSPLLCHLGNIAQFTGRALYCDPQTGAILNDDEAMNLWSRTYEPGWEPTS